MIRKDKKTFKDGTVKTFLRVVESYRPGKGKNPKQRTLRSFGYLEDAENPEALLREAEAYDASLGSQEINVSRKMYLGDNRKLNYGYKFIEAVYSALGISDFIKSYEKQVQFRGGYSIDDIFKYFVLLRILIPDSKRASLQRQQAFYNWEPVIELTDAYRALDHMAAFNVELQRFLDKRIRAFLGRDLSYAFYDVTNYFFHIDCPDDPGELRRKGVSKEHRVDPIVQMGLFIDNKGLPISMSLFPGNTSDCLTLKPILMKLKKAYELERLMVVADKGLNSSSNLDFICQNGDGFVFSQILRGKKGQRYHAALFDEEGYVWNTDHSSKYKLFTEEYTGKDAEGKLQIRKRQVLLYWDLAEAEMARCKRGEKLVRAETACKNNAYGIKKGVEEYIREEIRCPETGKLVDAKKRMHRSVDIEKAENDALFDGYFCLITSELDYDASKIREVYGGLWKIEQSFRVLKSDLLARPVCVSTQEHIQAHFLICFVALLISRLIQTAMGEHAISVKRLARALTAANCKVKRGGVVDLDDVGGSMGFEKRRNRKGELVDTLVFSDKDEVAQDYEQIQKVFGTEFYEAEVRQEVFNRFLKKISYPLAQ